MTDNRSATMSPLASPTARVWLWTALNLAVWPVGLFFATLAGIGQDPAGAGMYGGMALFGTVLVLGLPVSMRLVRLLRSGEGGSSRAARAVAILSVILILLVALPTLGLLILEGYWLPGLMAIPLLYLGFFGVSALRRS